MDLAKPTAEGFHKATGLKLMQYRRLLSARYVSRDLSNSSLNTIDKRERDRQ